MRYGALGQWYPFLPTHSRSGRLGIARQHLPGLVAALLVVVRGWLVAARLSTQVPHSEPLPGRVDSLFTTIMMLIPYIPVLSVKGHS